MMKNGKNSENAPDEVVITGIGAITVLGDDVREIWEKLNRRDFEFESKSKSGKELEFTVPLPPAKLRRMSRYSKLAIGGALTAQKDAGLDEITPDGVSEFRRGTIFTTGYGAMVSNVQFCNSVAGGEPDLCSPTLFAGTVPNSCVGQVCMQLNLKGPSTVLVGGNVLMYSKLLLQNGKADIIFAGAVEEYSEDLFNSLGENKFAANINVRESTVVFALEKRGNIKNIKGEAYCVIENSYAGSLDAYPLVKEVDFANIRSAAAQTIKRCVDDGVDAIVSSGNGGYFDNAELQAISEVLPGIPVVSEVKKYFGETMGSSLSVSVAVAAMCLKENKIFAAADCGGVCPQELNKILVTGFDTIGNYHAIILKKF